MVFLVFIVCFCDHDISSRGHGILSGHGNFSVHGNFNGHGTISGHCI